MIIVPYIMPNANNLGADLSNHNLLVEVNNIKLIDEVTKPFRDCT